MRLKADRASAGVLYDHPMPVDLVHLSVQTLGDHDLEAELLRLFSAQAPLCLDAYNRAADQSGRRHAAHTLKGSSMAVGAFALAEIAGLAELPGFKGKKDLEAEINRVLAFIQTLI